METFMNTNWARAILAGLVATLAMTAVGLWIAPMMGIPRMNPAEMLASAMGGSRLLGWLGHLMVGTILAIGYALVAPKLPGAPWLRGAVYGIAPWLLAQLVVIPMMGMAVFSGSFALAAGSLIGHLVYGAILGAVYGEPSPLAVRRPAVA
jgi:uncharacterized membrane protein YagU involved in acid resistance